jgi:hypothetical protein
MYAPQTLTVFSQTATDDGLGGVEKTWHEQSALKGYVDLLQGTNLPNGAVGRDKAFIEESTHVAIITEWNEVPKDYNRLRDEQGKVYEITYADDPVGVHHHLELYLRFISNASENLCENEELAGA